MVQAGPLAFGAPSSSWSSLPGAPSPNLTVVEFLHSQLCPTILLCRQSKKDVALASKG